MTSVKNLEKALNDDFKKFCAETAGYPALAHPDVIRVTCTQDDGIINMNFAHGDSYDAIELGVKPYLAQLKKKCGFLFTNDRESDDVTTIVFIMEDQAASFTKLLNSSAAAPKAAPALNELEAALRKDFERHCLSKKQPELAAPDVVGINSQEQAGGARITFNHGDDYEPIHIAVKPYIRKLKKAVPAITVDSNEDCATSITIPAASMDDFRAAIGAAAPAPAGSLTEKFNIVFTGALSVPRSAAQAEAKKLGHTVSDDVSAKTHFLIAGDKAGSKLAKAKKLGIPVLTEKEWKKLTSGNKPAV